MADKKSTKKSTKKSSSKKKTSSAKKTNQAEKKDVKKRLKDFPKNMTIKEFMDETGIPLNIVRQMMEEGELYTVLDENGRRLIPSFQIGRFIDTEK